MMAKSLTVVCGPSGTGKSTYIQERAKPGDVIVDFDQLFAALSGLPLYQRQPYGGHTWVALGLPSKSDRWAWQPQGEVVLLTVPPEECLRRIASDVRRQGVPTDWAAVVEDWWAVYRKEN